MAARMKSARAKSRVPARVNVKLTPYESDQISQIAYWKSQPPNPFAEIFRRITLPATKIAQKIVPDGRSRSNRTVDRARQEACR